MVRSETRRAWARLWVTITTVSAGTSVRISASMDSVATGSSAEVGLVEQQHLGADRQRAGQAEQLLLAAG